MPKEKYKTIKIDIDSDILWWLFQEAHKQDITLNQLVNKILLDYIDRLEKKSDKHVKDRVRRSTWVR